MFFSRVAIAIVNQTQILGITAIIESIKIDKVLLQKEEEEYRLFRNIFISVKRATFINSFNKNKDFVVLKCTS